MIVTLHSGGEGRFEVLLVGLRAIIIPGKRSDPGQIFPTTIATQCLRGGKGGCRPGGVGAKLRGGIYEFRRMWGGGLPPPRPPPPGRFPPRSHCPGERGNSPEPAPIWLHQVGSQYLFSTRRTVLCSSGCSAHPYQPGFKQLTGFTRVWTSPLSIGMQCTPDHVRANGVFSPL